MRKSMNVKVTSNVGDSFSNIYFLFLNLVVWHGCDQILDLTPIIAKLGQIKNCWLSSEVQYTKIRKIIHDLCNNLSTAL